MVRKKVKQSISFIGLEITRRIALIFFAGAVLALTLVFFIYAEKNNIILNIIFKILAFISLGISTHILVKGGFGDV